MNCATALELRCPHLPQARTWTCTCRAEYAANIPSPTIPKRRTAIVSGWGWQPSREAARVTFTARLRWELAFKSANRVHCSASKPQGPSIFVAGGIGITPILSMIRWCIRKGETWRLLYCVRSRARAAYLWDLAPHQGRVQLHVDEECAGRYPDVLSFLREAAPGAHVYCCGPGALMDAVARGASDAGIQATATHFERFTAEPRSSAGVAAESSFTVTLKRHGGTYTVEPGVSILQTLEQNGVALPFSCREGLCRTCEVPLLEGEAEHRDYVLSDDEHAANTTILICVSRARSPSLVLNV